MKPAARLSVTRLSVTRLSAAISSGPLASRNFRLLTVGQLSSTIGDYCYAVALPWLVLSAHGGPVLLGAVLACYGVPRTVLIPLGGVLADKLGPRTVMLAADAVRCAAVAVLAVFAARGMDSLAMLGPIAALLGAGEGVFLPASLAIMPGLLQPAQLQQGNALSAVMVQAGSLAGPVLGGILVATAGPAPAFAVDAASFAVSAAALALISTRRSRATAAAASQARPAEGAQQAAGPAGPAEPPGAAAPGRALRVWPLLRRSRLLQVLLLVVIVANLTSGGTFEVALPALAHASFGAGGYGALIACIGGGSLIGALVAARASGLRRPAVIACGAFLVEALATCLLPFLGGLPGAAAAILIFGICNGFGNIVMITLVQRWAPAELLGRVMSLVMLASLGSFPASVAISGFLVHRLGPAPFFPVAGIVLAITILGSLTQRDMRDFGAGRAQPAELTPVAA